MSNSNERLTLGDCVTIIAILALLFCLLAALIRGCSQGPSPGQAPPEQADADVRNASVKRQQQAIDGYREAAQGAADRVVATVGKLRDTEGLADIRQVAVLR